MLERTKKIVALGVMALSAAVISLPAISHAATSPSVAVLSPLVEGLRAPVKMVLDTTGNMYVADQRVRGVVKLDPQGKPLLTISTASIPTAVAVALDGSLLVAQSTVVVRYNATSGEESGRLVGGQLKYASGIAINSINGYIYVADATARQVEVYTASGQYVSAFGNGTLTTPSGIAFEKISGQLAVADTSSNKVQFFDANGNFAFIKSIGNAISGGTTTIYSGTISPMQFTAPVAVAYEYSKDAVPVLSRMYVADSYQGNIQVVDPATLLALNVLGTAKNYIGSAGTANGQLMTPSDVVFDAANSRLLVVNGIGNITVYGIDGGKNPVDTTPPTVSIDPVLATVYIPSITISGKVDAGATVSLLTGGSAVAGAVVYTSATTWKTDVTGLAPGENAISVTAKDAAGNTTQPLTVSTTYMLPAPALKISSSIPNLTNLSLIDISGTVDEGSTVTVTNATTSVNGAATVTGATWAYKAALVEGANSISVVAQKTSSEKTTASVGVTLDSVKPELNVSALSDGSYTSVQVQNLTGTVSDLSAVSVMVNDQQAPLLGGIFSVPVELVDGANVITVRAYDLAGNVSANSRTLNYDITKPVVEVISPMDNSYTNVALQQISGTVVDKASSVAAVTVGGVAAVISDNNSWTANVELVAGLNTVEVVATDLAGNTSSMKRSVTLDAVKPLLSISSPRQDGYISSSNKEIFISGAVSDNNADSKLSYSLDDGASISIPFSDKGTFAFKVVLLKKQSHVVAVTVTDAAGNTTTTKRSWIYKKEN